jgi:uncharacterized protein
VDISQIIDNIGGIQPFSVVVNAEEIGEADLWIQGDILVSGQICNVGTLFRLTGILTAKATLECSRCLKVFEQPVNLQFEEDLDAALFIYPNDWIDIAEALRTALIFQEPMKPLCSKDCKGLCVHCGVDRNQVDCDCDKKKIDPRLAVLGRLLEK